MALDDPILAFLAQPENLHLALEVEKKVIRLRDELHRQFWTEITAALQSGYELFVNQSHWEFIEPTGKYTRDWLSIGLMPMVRETLFLSCTMQQGTRQRDFLLRIGVNWCKRTESFPQLQPLKNITTTLAERGFKQDAWWPGVKAIGAIRTEPFMLRLVNEPDALITEIANEYWALFKLLEPDLLAANQALAAM